jgi:hypothetical protein
LTGRNTSSDFCHSKVPTRAEQRFARVRLVASGEDDGSVKIKIQMGEP